MITREIIDNQLFVYHNGRLIYKRWLRWAFGVVFDAWGGAVAAV